MFFEGRRGTHRATVKPAGARLTIALVSSVVLGSGCGTQAATGRIVSDPQSLTSCKSAFRAWIDGADSLNGLGADFVELAVQQEQIQRRVFELCTLTEAEEYNIEMPIQIAPGVTGPMIEPDFRTFADVECVDESPLLDGTPLCAEVGH